MKLLDLRRAAVKNASRVRFRLPDGNDCVINEHGLAQIPALNRATSINLERELESVREFWVEAGGVPQSFSREQAERWAAGAGGHAHQEDHDD
jgi:hypothetical protein